MLQWMGGSKHKVASSRRSVHNRQKHYFEQRKRQQRDPGHENLFNAQKHAHNNEERRSLDILSLQNLENSNSSRLIYEHDISKFDSHSCQLSPESVRTKVTSKFLGVFEKSCMDPGPKSPIKNSADNIYQNMPSISGNRADSDRVKVQSFPLRHPSNNVKQPSKTEELQDGISVLDLLGDDGPNILLDEGPTSEAHVAFSVEGLGKVEFGTPAHSPMRYVRNFPSPPDVQRRKCSSDKPSPSQNYFGEKMDITDIDYDEFSTEHRTMFTFSCTSPDACLIQNQPFSCKEENFQTGHNWENPSNGASFGIINQNNLNKKHDAKKKNNSSYLDSDDYIPFASKRMQDTSPDVHWRATFSPDSRFSCMEGKRSDESVTTSQYFWDLTSEKERSPDSYHQKRHHLYDKMTSPDSLFSPPPWFSSPFEDSHDSEESSSFDAVRKKSRHVLGSKAKILNDNKIKHKYKNQMWPTENYDTEIFSEGKFGTEVDEFFHEQYITKGKFKVESTWNYGSKYSKGSSTFDEKCTFPTSLGHKLISEEDIFDSIHVHPKSNRASRDFETEMSKAFPEADVHLPDLFQWDVNLPDKFDNDFNIQSPYLSKKKSFPEDIEDEYVKIPENPEKAESAEKNSLSSNGRNSCIADSKRNLGNNIESKDESQELNDTNQTRCSSIEIKDSPNEIPSQVPCTAAENIDPDGTRDPVPSQVPTKDPIHGNTQPESESYQIMLQLLYVQNILLQASQGKKSRGYSN